jgi:exopolysaccharide biosynthesis protein
MSLSNYLKKLKIFKFSFLLLFAFSVFANSIEYKKLKITDDQNIVVQEIHVLEFNPKNFDIKVVKALDDGIGRESVISLSNRHKAIAAINGGFFGPDLVYDGEARGILKINNFYALPKKLRGTIGWSKNDQRLYFDQIETKVNCFFKNSEIKIDGLNRQRKDDEILVYTPIFHKTTLTEATGKEIVVINNQIKKIRFFGSSKIPQNGFIISIGKNHPLFNSDQFKINEKISYKITLFPKIESKKVNWNNLDYIIGGAPLLIYKNKIIKNYDDEKILKGFLIKKHARTAVGTLSNGNVIFVVLDRNESNRGMSIEELAKLMKKLGCEYALNLDGGKSSSMVYNDKYLNTPFKEKYMDRYEFDRRVSDAIIITSKN